MVHKGGRANKIDDLMDYRHGYEGATKGFDFFQARYELSLGLPRPILMRSDWALALIQEIM